MASPCISGMASPLYYAACGGHIDAMKLLMDHGACVVNDIYANQESHANLTRLLTEHDIDINAQDEFGWTLLHWASEWGDINGMRLLINRGADVNIINNAGFTPLSKASRRNSDAIQQLLMANGAIK